LIRRPGLYGAGRRRAHRLTQVDAEQRVSQVITQAKNALDDARKIAAHFARSLADGIPAIWRFLRKPGRHGGGMRSRWHLEVLSGGAVRLAKLTRKEVL
jgi:hypothetical protein